MITTEQIKELRDQTSVSVMQCKKALEEAGGDMAKALIILRKISSLVAEKKSERTLGSGVVEAYVHGSGNIGVMLEIFCESDFVAKNEAFKSLAHDIAMHIAAMCPVYKNRDEIKEDDRKTATDLFSKEVEALDKPQEMKDKVLQGKLDAYFKEKILLEQPFIKNPDVSINDLINGVVQKVGERIEVGRFVRYSLNN